MTNDEKRILKLCKCREVKFYGKDVDEDTIFVDIDGDNAQQILDILKTLILKSNEKEDSSFRLK